MKFFWQFDVSKTHYRLIN